MTTAVGQRRSDLPVRAVVGVALIVVALLDIWLGGTLFWGFACLVGLQMAREFWGLVHATPGEMVAGVAALIVPLVLLAPELGGPRPLVLGLIFAAAALVAVVTRRTQIAFGTLYIGLPIFALVWLRERPDGLLLALWALALVWATDIGAYFAGRAIGGPKLAPRISPNKTWAGLVGGVLAAGILGTMLTWFAGLPWLLALASPLLGAVAQAGDLYESWLKRRANVKDSGHILPGHGGVLDRLDGMITAVPVAALLVWLQPV